MLARIAAIALNTYREAVRARVLFGLLGAALATTLYSLVVATLSLHQEERVVSDVGAASISLYAIIVATLFSSFSSPFLTAVFTFGVFLAGRSADTMARMPVAVFGEEVHDFFAVIARIIPNLHVYVPARPLLLGQVPSSPVWSFVALAAAHALFYATVLLTLSALVLRKRDFQ